MKFASAQINTTACDIAGNIAKGEKAWDWAEAQGADLVVLPEQWITGYPLQDMAANPDVLATAKLGFNHLVEKSKQHKTAILACLPIQGVNGAIYNAAYIVDNGVVSAPIIKQHLPNHDVFDEKRIYTEGPRTEPVEFRGHKFGIAICEDIWHPDVIADLVAKGAQAIISPNGSPYYTGKHNHRLENVMRQRIVNEGNAVPMLYVNQVGGQDEVVFDGYSTAMNADGEIMMIAKNFEEDFQILDLEFPEKGPARFKQSVVNPVAPELEETWNALVTCIRDYIDKSGIRRKKALLGMSGGIDSAVVAALAVDALGPENVMLYKLPSKYSSDHSIKDADDAAKMLGCEIEEINIEPIAQIVRATLVGHFNPNANTDIMDENMQSRIRGLLLMALSNGNGGMLLTTGNKSEVGVGYCTLYGDTNGGFNPLKDVYKQKVFALADWRNKNVPKNSLGPKGMAIPQNIIVKPPSAELKEDQKDQDSLPPYDVLDDIEKRYLEQDQSLKQIFEETGYDLDVIQDVVRKADLAEFKRRQTCPGGKTTERDLGSGRRVPICRPNTVQMLKDAVALQGGPDVLPG